MSLPWAFAAIAAAFVLLRRPAGGSQDLSPIGSAAPAAPDVRQSPHPLTLAAILVAGGMIAFAILESRTPVPPPPMPTALDLSGKFTGPSAAEDAAITSALLAELADIVEYDGQQAQPRIKTGAAIHELRTAARELRCKGTKLGDRQPAARDAIKAYLDSKAGTDGGPVDEAERAKWVEAYRAVSRAASAALGR